MILSYTVGRAEVLDTAGLEAGSAWNGHAVFSRTLNIGRSPRRRCAFRVGAR